MNWMIRRNRVMRVSNRRPAGFAYFVRGCTLTSTGSELRRAFEGSDAMSAKAGMRGNMGKVEVMKDDRGDPVADRPGTGDAKRLEMSGLRGWTRPTGEA